MRAVVHPLRESGMHKDTETRGLEDIECDEKQKA